MCLCSYKIAFFTLLAFNSVSCPWHKISLSKRTVLHPRTLSLIEMGQNGMSCCIFFFPSWCDDSFPLKWLHSMDSQKRIFLRIKWRRKISQKSGKEREKNGTKYREMHCCIQWIQIDWFPSNSMNAPRNEQVYRSQKSPLIRRMQPFSFIFLRSSLIQLRLTCFCEWVARFQGNPNSNSKIYEIVLLTAGTASQENTRSVTKCTFLIRSKKKMPCALKIYEINVAFHSLAPSLSTTLR